MATSPIYSWPEPDNTDLVKNGALAIRTLGNAIDTTMGTMVAKTVVDAKGDLIAGTAADTVNRLAVGNNGETLVADSSTSTGLRYTAGTVQANPVLNAAMQNWQRGTSFTNCSSVYTADRWFTFTNGVTTGRTFSRQATNDTTNLPNIQYCARFARDSGNTNTGGITLSQPFETLNSIPFAGKTITLSFYARAGANYSPTSSALGVLIVTGTGTDQNQQSGGYTGQALPLNTNATLTTTWQRFTYNATIASTATELSPLFQFIPTGTAGANDWFEITGVQIDIGSVALPFRTYAGTIQGELAACQRYYIRFNAVATYGFIPLTGYASSSTGITFGVIAPVTTRVTPSAIDFGGAWQTIGSANLSISSFTSTCENTNRLAVTATVTGATVGGFYNLLANNNAASYLGFTAEL